MSEEKGLEKAELDIILPYIKRANEDDCIAIEDVLIKRMTALGFTEDDESEDNEKEVNERR